MKFIHTGDWHIGKIVNEFHMTEDQQFILDQFIELIKEEKPHAVVIAGDLYDRSVAPVEAVELLDRVFTKIIMDLHTPVILVAGNHDSCERLSFGSNILKNKGLYIEGMIKKDIEKVSIKDEFGVVNFYMLPYTEPAVVRELFSNNNIKTHDDAMKAIIEKIGETINLNERNVLVTHGFVIGGEDPEISDSERPLSIGGSEYIKVDHFKNFNYTALGHLHGPQKVGSNKVRYSGSLLKYSFSEVKQKKSVTIVNMDENGNVEVELKELKPIRNMRIIKGELKALLDPEVYKDTEVEDYLSVVLTDEGEIIEAMSKLRAVYPNVMLLTRENKKSSNETLKSISKHNYKTKSKVDLFSDFYRDIIGSEFNDEKKKVIIDVIEEVEKEEGR